MPTVAGGIFDNPTVVDDTVGNQISTFLDNIGLPDTALSNITITTPVVGGTIIGGTSSTTDTVFGSISNTILVAGDDTVSGGSGADSVTGSVSDGDFQATVELPKNTGLSMKGLNFVASGTQVADYLKSLVDNTIPDTATVDNQAAAKLKTTLTKTIGTVVKATDTNTVVRVVDIVSNKNDTSSTPKEVKLTGSSTSTNTEVVAVNANKLRAGDSLVVENLEKVVVVGSGKIKVSETQTTAVTIAGDDRDQEITGGAGNDTIVGGGGNDTLTGGAGDDTYILGSGGSTTISGIDSGDKIGFNIDGITDFASLKAAVSKVEIDGDNLIATFNDGTVITLAGVNAGSVTSDLFSFDG